MTTTIAFASADGMLTSINASYATAVAGSGITVDTASNSLYWGQNNNGGTYTILQSFLSFTYTPVATEKVTAAYIRVDAASNLSTAVSRDLVFAEYDWGGTLEAADWRTPAQLNALTTRATITNAEDAGTNYLMAGSNGLVTRLASASPLRVVAASSRHRAQTTPTSDEGSSFWSSDLSGTSSDPALIYTSLPLSTLYRVLGAQVQLSDGTHVFLEYNDTPDATLDSGVIRLRHHDGTTATTIDTLLDGVPACVDPLTEMFTRSGWKTYEQVLVGDETLAINPATGESEWVEVSQVRAFEDDHYLVRLVGPGFAAAATRAHRWLVQRDGAWLWRTTTELEPGDFIPTDSVPVAVADLVTTEEPYSGTVWCPTTGHGNWLARRNGTVFYTGNKP